MEKTGKMSKEKKQRLKEYQKKKRKKTYHEAKKSQYIIINKIVLMVYSVIYAN